MSESAAQIAIENRFYTTFTGVAQTYIKFANVEFSPPDKTDWVELDVIISDSVRAEIGGDSPLHRAAGLISVNVNVPKGTGTVPGKAIAERAAAIFRDASFSGITCHSPAITNVGEVDQWYVINMTVPFYRDTNY